MKLCERKRIRIQNDVWPNKNELSVAPSSG